MTTFQLVVISIILFILAVNIVLLYIGLHNISNNIKVLMNAHNENLDKIYQLQGKDVQRERQDDE